MRPLTPRARLFVGALSAAASLWLAACFALPNTGPTAVSRAELYESSEPEYDAFFLRLHKIQKMSIEAPTEQHALHRALATELGLAGHASSDLIFLRFEKKLEELSKRGSTLSIEFIGLEDGAKETDAVVTLNDAKGNPQSTSLINTLTPVAKRTAKLVVQLRAASKSIEKLQAMLPQLESSREERFRLLGPARAKETQRNLTDARVALSSLTKAVRRASTDAEELVTLLQKASPPPETEEPTKK